MQNIDRINMEKWLMGNFHELMPTNLVPSYPDVVGSRWQRIETDHIVVIFFIAEGHSGLLQKD